MNAEPDLFSLGYPNAPAFRAGSDTSFAAAQSIDAGTLQGMVISALKTFGPQTPDEIASRLHVDKGSIRPRLTELKRIGRVVDAGIRRANKSGRSAAVLKLAA